jgi:tripartite-type tricarboxylate transporter receptor subunit TctC
MLFPSTVVTTRNIRGERTRATLLSAAVLLTFALPPVVQAQSNWPAKPITLIVPFAPGGGVDASARIQALAMGELLGQTIVVENVGAAAGQVGTQKVARAEPDGYTMLIGNSGTHVYTQLVYKKLLYNSTTDFAPIGLATDSPRILIARKDLPVGDLREFIAYAKANQAKMQFGSAGVGAGTHLPCVLLTRAIGVDITHVPYRGAGPAMQDLIGGRIDFMCDTIQTGAAQAKKGTVRGIAVMAPKRVSIIADLATTGEQGTAGLEASVWNGLFFPKGTPEPIVRRTNKAMSDMLDNPAIRKRLEDLGLEIATPERRRPEYLAGLVREELERWGAIVRAAKISAD